MEPEIRAVGRVDAALAGVLTAAMVVAALVTGPPEALARIGAAVVALGLLALAVRRRRPFAVTLAVAVVVVVAALAAPQGATAPTFLALMVAGYSLGAHARPAALASGLAVAVGAVATVQILLPQDGYSHASAIGFFAAVLVLAPAAVGGVVRIRANLTRRVRMGTEALRASAAGTLADRRTELRLRISGDIERVVLGGLESMRPHAAVRDLADVTALRDLGRDVLGRMRGLLGSLRAAGDAEPPRVPGQGLAQLRTQVERVLATGAEERPVPLPRWTLLTPARADSLLAVITGGYALLAIAAHLGDPVPAGRRVLTCLAAAATVLPAAGVRRWPLPATCTGLVAALAFAALDPRADPLGGVVAGAVLIGYPLLVAVAAGLRTAVAGLALCLATAVLATVLHPGALPAGSDLVSAAAVIVGSWAAGRVLRTGATALAESAAAGAREELRQRAQLREALDADRARVARDLHDAVGHAMTGIVLQATAAVRVWDSEPALAARHVAALRGTLAEALDDLRPLVTSIALEGAETPGLAALPLLVERARACGLDATCEIGTSFAGDPPTDTAANDNAPIETALNETAYPDALLALDPATDSVAYRIVQEALTNAARYAPGARVTIRIGYPAGSRPNSERASSERPSPQRVSPERANPETRSVVVAVENAASPYREVVATGSGHGLRGMAERVAGHGGTLRAGATPAGGFRVYARLPICGPA